MSGGNTWLGCKLREWLKAAYTIGSAARCDEHCRDSCKTLEGRETQRKTAQVKNGEKGIIDTCNWEDRRHYRWGSKTQLFVFMWKHQEVSGSFSLSLSIIIIAVINNSSNNIFKKGTQIYLNILVNGQFLCYYDTKIITEIIHNTGWDRSRFTVILIENNTIINTYYKNKLHFTYSQLYSYFCPTLYYRGIKKEEGTFCWSSYERFHGGVKIATVFGESWLEAGIFGANYIEPQFQ